MESTTPTESKIAFEADFKAEYKRRVELEAQIDLLKKDKANLQSQLSQAKKKSGVVAEIKPELDSDQAKTPQIEEQKGPEIMRTHIPAPIPTTTITAVKPEDLSPHKFHAWEAGCTTCGVANPVFKPEMKCDPKKGGCGGILGSFETALQMKNCPHCLKSVEAAPNNEDGLKKATEFLAKPRIVV